MGGTVLASLWAPSIWPFRCVVALLAFFALWEFLNFARHKGISSHQVVGQAVAMIWILMMPGSAWAWLWGLVLVMFALQFMRRREDQAMFQVSITLFGLIYVAGFLAYFVRLREEFPDLQAVLYCIFVAKSGDIAAYFIGRRWGHTPWVPRISPRKTVEGALAGLLTSMAVGWLAGGMVGLDGTARLGAAAGVTFLALFGDLAESLLKRDCQVKDASDIVPGFGGLLDVLDSLLLSGPFLYYYLRGLH